MALMEGQVCSMMFLVIAVLLLLWGRQMKASRCRQTCFIVSKGASVIGQHTPFLCTQFHCQ
jgi:hypothetical protein